MYNQDKFLESNSLFKNRVLKKANIPKNNLPAETMEFVGQENEIEKIGGLLNKARLITLIGPGGIGKTRLSLKVAAKHIFNYRDGVFLVSLSTVTQGNLLIPSIAKVLGIPEIEGQETLNSIKVILQNKKLLIILDNFEQIVDKATLIAELLASVPLLSVLVTSREPLNIYGEHLYYVPPLEFPNTSRKIPIEAIKRQAAVTLFLSRAKAVQHDFTLTKDNAMRVAMLCECLEGIPLAIELAAANIGQMSIQKMLNQSKNRLNWLKNGAKDLPDRQRTLRNTIEWGYNLLNENQKKVFMRLGVFKSSFDSKAVSKVVNSQNDFIDIHGYLMSLVNKSILFRSGELKDGEYYFNMLEIIREYAAELLLKSNEEEFIRDCHADYFLSLVVQAENGVNGANRQKWLDILEIAYPDIIEALEHLKSTGSFEKEIKLAAAMGYYWAVRGCWSPGQAILENIISRWDNVSHKQFFGEIYRWYACFTYFKGNYEKALQIYEEALAFSHKTNDFMGQAVTGQMMATTAKRLGNYKYAEELMLQSLKVYSRVNYKPGIADVHRDLGQLYYFKGENGRAEKHSKESMQICMELGDRHRLSKAFGMIGLVARGKGNYNEALDMLNRYLASSEELDDKPGTLDALMSIAEIARSRGNYEEAQDYYLKSLKIGRELGYMSIIARALKELGEIYRCKGDFKRAYELFEESLAILEKTGERGDEIWIYRNMGELELQQGNSLKSEGLFLKGIKVYIDIKEDTLIYVFLVIEGLAGVALSLEQLDRASCLFGAAERLYKVIGNLPAKSDIEVYESRLSKLRQKMNERDFYKSWNEGNRMSLDHLFNYALKINEYRYDKIMADKMINYIHENYYKDISLSDVSEHFNMSANYLSTMFKYYTGKNYKDYLNFYRVKTAKELLKNGDLKVNEVSKMVGCSNDVTFIRMFKKYEGISPRQYFYEQIKNDN